MSKRALRRWQAEYHMWRRLKEDRAQHSVDRYVHGMGCRIQYDGPLNTQKHCPCFWDKKAMARFKEQPKHCRCCMSDRYHPLISGKNRLTLQERRAEDKQKSFVAAD